MDGSVLQWSSGLYLDIYFSIFGFLNRIWEHWPLVDPEHVVDVRLQEKEEEEEEEMGN